MADSFISKLITELTAKTTASDTDLVPIADSNGNFFKMTFAKLKELITHELNTNMFKVFAPIYNGSVLQVAIKPGIYTYNDGTTDKPSNAVAGMVIVKEAGNWMIRLAVDANGNIYTSIYKPGKDWGTWVAK